MDAQSVYNLRSDGLPQREIAAQLGVSTQRVDQIEKAALKKCRAWCDRHRYTLVDLLRSNPRRYAATNRRITCSLAKMVHNDQAHTGAKAETTLVLKCPLRSMVWG